VQSTRNIRSCIDVTIASSMQNGYIAEPNFDISNLSKKTISSQTTSKSTISNVCLNSTVEITNSEIDGES